MARRALMSTKEIKNLFNSDIVSLVESSGFEITGMCCVIRPTQPCCALLYERGSGDTAESVIIHYTQDEIQVLYKGEGLKGNPTKLHEVCPHYAIMPAPFSQYTSFHFQIVSLEDMKKYLEGTS